MTTPAPKNGCHNRAPYKATNDLRDLDGRVVTSIPHTMTTDCQYTKSELGQADPRCVGCSWRREPLPWDAVSANHDLNTARRRMLDNLETARPIERPSQ